MVFVICGLLFGFLWDFMELFAPIEIFGLVLLVCAYNSLAFICTLIYAIIDYIKGDIEKSFKVGMIVKLAQIPLYVAVFVFSLMLVLGMITIVFDVFIFFSNCFCVCLTGMITAPANLKALKLMKKEDRFTWVLLSILEFIMDIDIIMLFIQRSKIKKLLNDQKEAQSNNEEVLDATN